MPALLGPLVGFALGAALACLRGVDRDARHGVGVVALYGALVYAPVNAYFLAFAGDWSFAYFLDSRRVPSALELLLVVLDAAVVPAGFLLGRARTLSGSLGAALTLAAVPAVVALLALLVCLGRLSVDASFQQYRLDFGTQPVAGSGLGYALLWMLAMLGAGFTVTARALSGGQRPAQPPPGRPQRSPVTVAPPPPYGRR